MEAFKLENVELGCLKAFIINSASPFLIKAQKLRYKIFFEELQGNPSDDVRQKEIDFDDFDDVCDHLIIVDTSQLDADGMSLVVGTYRLLRKDGANKIGKFYSQDEFDLTELVNNFDGGEVLELGRSCVHPNYRDRSTIQLLWSGIAAYMSHYKIDLLFGCASFHGTSSEEIKYELSYLHHNHAAPAALEVKALKERYVEMNLVPADEINNRRVLTKLPALIKGYLRLGGFIGNGAVYDFECNTTDVFIILKRDLLPKKYANHYFGKNGA